jgi:hypothetical protein
MTIERTRELLGENIANLTDDEVLLLIQRTEKSIDTLFQLAVKRIIDTQKEKSLL